MLDEPVLADAVRRAVGSPAARPIGEFLDARASLTRVLLGRAQGARELLPAVSRLVGV